MRKGTIATLLSFSLSATPLLAQDWAAVQALPTDARVRIEEQGGRAGHVEGRIRSVEESQLTLAVGGQLIAVPRSSIGRLTREHRDPVWTGMLIGAAISLVMRVAFAGEACSGTRDPQCTITGALVGAGLGGLVDYQIKRHRVIYEASQPTMTILRLAF